MNLAQYIKEIGRGASGAADLGESEAELLYGAILDGGVPELELGAILLALRMKGESPAEMLGFLRAAEARVFRLLRPASVLRPVVLPTYNGARKSANLTPLLALLLQRFGVPVVLHGLLEGYGRVTSAQILRELGTMPAATQSQAQQQLEQKGLVFVPLHALAPGLAEQLALRSRLGLRNCAHSLVKMLDPFQGEAVLLAAATHPPYLDLMRDILVRKQQTALLLRATEGEPYANPKRRPRLELIQNGAAQIIFEAEHDSLKALPLLPEDLGAGATARWTLEVLEGRQPLPQPVANQLALCLHAAGAAPDLAQAKALVAVEAQIPSSGL